MRVWWRSAPRRRLTSGRRSEEEVMLILPQLLDCSSLIIT
jgi:hypothetical protein